MSQVRREEHRATKDKEIYERIRRQLVQGRDAVASGTRALKAVDVIGLYEVKREAADREIAALRAEVILHPKSDTPSGNPGQDGCTHE